jgi:hypothetical protein
MTMPGNEYKVGHAGVAITLILVYSTGERYAVSLNVRNEDMTDYLLERLEAFSTQYPKNSARIALLNQVEDDT